MNMESFYEYIANCFYQWLEKHRVQLPIVLFLDGHTSHISLALSEFCKEKGIILVALLPNSTHVLQPLDVAVFRPVKATWRNVVHDFRLNHEMAKIKRTDFSGLVKICFDKCLKEETIKNGFKWCGLFPFNASKVQYNKLFKTKTNIAEPSTGTFEIPNKDQNNQETQEFKQQFESRLASETLCSFKSSGSSWQGDPTFEKLFVYWKSLDDKNLDVKLDDKNEDLQITLNDTTFINNISSIGNFNEDNWDVLDFEVQENGNLAMSSVNSSTIDDLQELFSDKNNLEPGNNFDVNEFKDYDSIAKTPEKLVTRSETNFERTDLKLVLESPQRTQNTERLPSNTHVSPLQHTENQQQPEQQNYNKDNDINAN
uniref:Uncharacterized protein LOC114347427 isoform X2 n=1 Tax=Diabrotica virgifera virgifera TaxID=50390 RepID=A0A6P7GWS7_DIAVI